MSVTDLPCSTAFQIGAVPPYDFVLSVRKPAGWSLLTPFETFEDGTLWTGMRLNSGEMFGLKLRSKGTIEKPQILCRVCSRKKVNVKRKEELSETV